MLDSPFELAHAADQVGDPRVRGRHLEPDLVIRRRASRNVPARLDRRGDSGLRRCDHAFANLQMPGSTDLACENYTSAGPRRTGEPNLRAKQIVWTDLATLADMTRIGHSRSGCHACLAQCRPVNRRTGADVHSVLQPDDTSLRDAIPGALVGPGVPKTV